MLAEATRQAYQLTDRQGRIQAAIDELRKHDDQDKEAAKAGRENRVVKYMLTVSGANNDSDNWNLFLSYDTTRISDHKQNSFHVSSPCSRLIFESLYGFTFKASKHLLSFCLVVESLF